MSLAPVHASGTCARTSVFSDRTPRPPSAGLSVSAVPAAPSHPRGRPRACHRHAARGQRRLEHAHAHGRHRVKWDGAGGGSHALHWHWRWRCRRSPFPSPSGNPRCGQRRHGRGEAPGSGQWPRGGPGQTLPHSSEPRKCRLRYVYRRGMHASVGCMQTRPHGVVRLVRGRRGRPVHDGHALTPHARKRGPDRWREDLAAASHPCSFSAISRRAPSASSAVTITARPRLHP
jgi:hypothetical protein